MDFKHQKNIKNESKGEQSQLEWRLSGCVFPYSGLLSNNIYYTIFFK